MLVVFLFRQAPSEDGKVQSKLPEIASMSVAPFHVRPRSQLYTLKVASGTHRRRTCKRPLTDSTRTL